MTKDRKLVGEEESSSSDDDNFQDAPSKRIATQKRYTDPDAKESDDDDGYESDHKPAKQRNDKEDKEDEDGEEDGEEGEEGEEGDDDDEEDDDDEDEEAVGSKMQTDDDIMIAVKKKRDELKKMDMLAQHRRAYYVVPPTSIKRDLGVVYEVESEERFNQICSNTKEALWIPAIDIEPEHIVVIEDKQNDGTDVQTWNIRISVKGKYDTTDDKTIIRMIPPAVLKKVLARFGKDESIASSSLNSLHLPSDLNDKLVNPKKSNWKRSEKKVINTCQIQQQPAPAGKGGKEQGKEAKEAKEQAKKPASESDERTDAGEAAKKPEKKPAAAVSRSPSPLPPAANEMEQEEDMQDEDKEDESSPPPPPPPPPSSMVVLGKKPNGKQTKLSELAKGVKSSTTAPAPAPNPNRKKVEVVSSKPSLAMAAAAAPPAAAEEKEAPSSSSAANPKPSSQPKNQLGSRKRKVSNVITFHSGEGDEEDLEFEYTFPKGTKRWKIVVEYDN